MIDTTLRVNESFTSIQGEGFWTGTPCYFIRLQGCTMRCSFCDSKSTWDTNGGTLMTFQQILDDILVTIRHVVITGGEPTLHSNLPDLVEALAKAGYRVHIETNGTHYDILKELVHDCWIQWITISPKQHIPTSEVLLLADEIKWVVQTEQDLWTVDKIWEELVQKRLQHREGWREGDLPLFYLQPVSCEREATDLCVRHVLTNADRDYRLSIQIHRYLGVE